MKQEIRSSYISICVYVYISISMYVCMFGVYIIKYTLTIGSNSSNKDAASINAK